MESSYSRSRQKLINDNYLSIVYDVVVAKDRQFVHSDLKECNVLHLCTLQFIKKYCPNRKRKKGQSYINPWYLRIHPQSNCDSVYKGREKVGFYAMYNVKIKKVRTYRLGEEEYKMMPHATIMYGILC